MTRDAEHFGEYLEIDRPRRMVFTFSVDRESTEADRAEGAGFQNVTS